VADLVALKPAVILVGSTAAILAARQVTRTTQLIWFGKSSISDITRPEITPQRLDCLAEDAVLIGPVSKPKFPANREKNREFCGFGPPARFSRPVSEQIQWLAAEFPTHPNREFLIAYQGKISKEQGISLGAAMLAEGQSLEHRGVVQGLAHRATGELSDRFLGLPLALTVTAGRPASSTVGR
jgi:hypothetical protein